MGRIDLIIVDKNLEYIELLTRYIRETEYEKKFLIKTFSNVEYLEKYLESHSSIEILLIDAEDLSEILSHKSIKLIILLSDTSVIDEKCQYDCIYKFQPLNKIVSRILGLYLEKCSGWINLIEGNKTKVISVYSASGGSGKTTLAINLAKQLAIRYKKVFYLNLESINATEIFFSKSESYDFSKILFYLKNNPSIVVSRIETYKKYSPDINVDYIETFINSNELFEMSKNDIKILLEAIKSLEIYDYIILDLETSLQEYVISSLLESKLIFWPILDDIQSIHKTKNVIKLLHNNLDEVEYLDLTKSINFILNKYSDKDIKNDFSKYEINLSGHLPYVPEWETIINKNQIFNNYLYINKLNSLLISLGIN